MTGERFGRGQLEAALWRSFTRTFQRRDDVVPVRFKTRIKRLTELDRQLDLSDNEVPPEAKYAFAPAPSAESGLTEYSEIDAFCLGVALDILDHGYKQSEVVELMRHLRPDLEARYPEMQSPSVIDRQRHFASDETKLPAYEQNGSLFEDGRHYLVLQQIEFTEIISEKERHRYKAPVILEPYFAAGIEALTKVLHRLMPDHRRIVTVVELAATAQSVARFLPEVPEVRRGRPPTRR